MIRCFRHFGLLAAVTLLWAGGGRAAEPPPDLLKRLQAEQYADREQAGAELLAWARLHPAEALDALYGLSRTAPEAEVRGRCLEALRVLVEEEYQRDGVGFMGIRMNQLTERADVAGEAKPRFGVRVLDVEDDTPARLAGLKAGDLLLGINEWMLQAGDDSLKVTQFIKGFKPGIKVSVTLYRDGKVAVVPLVLGKRPAAADLLLGFGERPSPEMAAAMEKSAKDEYFRSWLANKRANTR
jgi:GNAT superfamily N-acetyltransferase